MRRVYRYLAGRILDGTGTGGYLRPGVGSWWRQRPGWQRQTLRVWVPLAYLVGTAHPDAATWVLLATAAVGGPVGVRRAARWWRLRRFHATYTRPTRAALALALGDSPVELRVDPGLGSLMTRLVRPMSPAEQAVRVWYGQHLEPTVRWLPDHAQLLAWRVQRAALPVTRRLAKLRRPVDDPGQRIEVRTEVPYLTPEQQQIVKGIVEAKLPAGELVSTVNQVGRRVTLTWTVRKRPPLFVGFADLAARFDRLKESEFFLGLAADGRPVVIDLHDDAPHIALSAGSGAGKSVFAQLVGVQLLARGGRVTLLDRKGSHRWARGLDGVEYCTRPEQMHQALTRGAAVADDRNATAFEQDDDWVAPWHRELVIAEELNATMAQIRAWWEQEREKGQPKIPPAVRAFRELLFMGRSAKINVLAVAQMLTALTTGGPESRENFGVRALARFTKNNWQMLTDAPMPRPSRTLGRWQVVVQGEATETQVCYLTPREARLFVAQYRGVPASPVSPRSPLTGADQEMSPGHGASGDTVDPRDELLTLRQFVERGTVGWGYDAAKKRLQRTPKDRAPKPVPDQPGQAHVYRAGDLVAWALSETTS